MDIVTSAMYAADPPLEYMYHIGTSNAFKTINAALFSTLSRWNPHQRLDRDEIDGATVYPLNAAGTLAQLYVTHITDGIASIRLHFLIPTHSASFMQWRDRPMDPTARHLLALLFADCHAEVVRVLRYAASVEVRPAPHPAKSDLQSWITWQEVHEPDMRDEELAKLIGIEHQSLRNARRKLGMRKNAPNGQLVRVSRGRQNK